MAIIHHKPVTPSTRFYTRNKAEVTDKRPERSLTKGHHRKKGRNSYGRITSRRRGGGHKRLYRTIDFRRDIIDVPATVEAIEYDPNRSSHIALLKYEDGTISYIPAPLGVEIGDTLISSNGLLDFKSGNSMPISFIPIGTRVHCVELLPGCGAKLARSAGVGVRLMSIDDVHATLKMPS